MKIFIIGNSHVACLKQAWVEIFQHFNDIEIIFFAHRAKKIDGLIGKGNSLVPSNQKLLDAIKYTSGGYSEIPLAEPDVLYLHGMGLKMEMPDGYFSELVIQQTYIDRAKVSVSSKLLTKIRSITEVPILIGHDPLPAASEDLSKSDFKEYYNNIDLINNEVFLEKGAKLIPQPEDTLFSSYKTKMNYSLGSSRLSIGRLNDGELHPDNDKGHMNSEYGKLVLYKIIDYSKNMDY